jgi:hypothetical protein
MLQTIWEHPKCVNLFFCSDGSLARFLDIREQDAPTTNFIFDIRKQDAPNNFLVVRVRCPLIRMGILPVLQEIANTQN